MFNIFKSKPKAARPIFAPLISDMHCHLLPRVDDGSKSEEESVTILEQLLSGEKTAVGHCIPAYLATKRRMPRAGDYTMVTDYYGNPCCILYTSGVSGAYLRAVAGAETGRESGHGEPFEISLQ